jgi:hypothetical protein
MLTTYAIFTDEMLNILASMKHKTLKSFEGDFSSKFDYVDGIFRINFNGFVFDVSCFTQPKLRLNYDGSSSLEDFAVFSCVKKKPSEKIDAYFSNPPLCFVKNEVVSEVLVVRDDINISSGEHIVMDQALIIKTREKAYTFTRKDWFIENISITTSDSLKGYRTVKQVKTEWEDEGLFKVEVKREIVFL